MLSVDYAVHTRDQDSVASCARLGLEELRHPFFGAGCTSTLFRVSRLEYDPGRVFLVRWFLFSAEGAAYTLRDVLVSHDPHGRTELVYMEDALVRAHRLVPPPLPGLRTAATDEAPSLEMPLDLENDEYEVFAEFDHGTCVTSEPWVQTEVFSREPQRAFFYTLCGEHFVRSPGVCGLVALIAVVGEYDRRQSPGALAFVLRITAPVAMLL